MRMPDAKVCVLNFAVPACVLLLVLSATACGSPPESDVAAAQAGQSTQSALRDVERSKSVREEASTHLIEIKSFRFEPAVIIAKKGDRIRWRNLDVAPHTATADDKTWDSKAIANQSEWSLTVDELGVVDYICAYHPAMTGRIIVE